MCEAAKKPASAASLSLGRRALHLLENIKIGLGSLALQARRLSIGLPARMMSPEDSIRQMAHEMIPPSPKGNLRCSDGILYPESRIMRSHCPQCGVTERSEVDKNNNSSRVGVVE